MPTTATPQAARVPLWGDAMFDATATQNQRAFSMNKPFFVSPPAAGRRITAGFSWMQRIGKGTSMDVWFPDELRRELDAIIDAGGKVEPKNFPAEWAAVREFDLLQEAGNHKIYDLNAGYLERTLVDLSRSMRSGGYRVMVATIGGYGDDQGDDLEILDQRLQDRIARLTHMLYLEEESANTNAALDKVIAEERWDYRTAVPHVALALGERDLFTNAKTVTAPAKRKQERIQKFFDILSELPQNHIVHDTAVGLQLPELAGEHEWLYIAEGTETFSALNQFMTDIFRPHDRVSLSRLHGREDAGPEFKPAGQHMRGYGDHVRDSTSSFYSAASSALHGSYLR